MRPAVFKSTLFEIILLSSALVAMSVAEAVNIPVSGVLHAVCNADLPCFTLTGPDFSLVEGGTNQTTGNAIRFPGQGTNLNVAPIADQFATLTFQGINYLPVLGPVTGPRIFGTVNGLTPSIPFPENPPPLIQLTAPAIVSAILAGQNPTTNEFVMFNLIGFGSATGTFVVCEGPSSQCSPIGAALMQQINYEITAVPEPSTWLLVSSGVGVLWAFCKKIRPACRM